MLAIIPARGGSKGIPRKNVVELCGKPLIVWTIEQALAAERVSHVVVATDDDEIADASQQAGAEVFWRSPATATDTASTESALLEVLHNVSPDLTPLTVLLQATSPIRQPQDIDNAIAELLSSSATSLFSARLVDGYFWLGRLTQEPVLVNGPRKPRQQEDGRYYEENGSIYVFRTQSFLDCQVRLCGHKAMYLMHPLDSFQVDEPDDLALFEQLIPLRMPHACHAAAAN